MKASSLALAIAVLSALIGYVAANDEGWQDRQPPGTEQQLAWRSRIRSTLYVPDPLPPLDAETHGRFEPAPGVVAERVTYGTQFGMRVPGILYLPRNHAGKIPALVVLNGHGGDKFSWYAFYSGVLYASAGAAVLTYDPIGEGERNLERKSGTRAHDRPLSPESLGRRMGGLMLTEAMQAVAYLAQRPEVDPGRIGAMGYSMGSFVLSLAGAVDERVKVCVLAGGGNLDGPGGIWDSGKPMCQGIPYQSLSFLGDRPAAIYALHAGRGPTLIVNGLGDSVVGIPKVGEGFFPDLRQRTARLLGRHEGLFEYYNIPDVSHRPFFVTKRVALWLEERLDFPHWAEADIREMGTTHIGRWARHNQVEMDRTYATEEREAGTEALGKNVPGLRREALFVFSLQEWARRKGELIYEEWVKHAENCERNQ